MRAETPKEARATLESDTQSRHGDIFNLSGDVIITYRDHTLRADTITYDSATGEILAQGHIRLTGGENDEQIEADHGTYNLRKGTGRFYDVQGSVGLHTDPNAAGAQNPFRFAGRLVVKTSDTAYDVYDGWVTSCQLPHPDWQLFSRHLWMADNKAHAAKSTFRLLNIPVFFLPYVTQPTNTNTRQSGLMIPVISQSSTKGFVIGDQVYLTLGRSADATAGFEYFSSRGFSEMGTVRYRGHGDDFFNAHFTALQDRGYTDNFGNLINQGGQDVTSAFRYDFTRRTRAVADLEYLSSYVYREAFNDNFNQAVSSDITSIGYIIRSHDGFAVAGRVERYQGLKRVPVTNQAGQEVRIFHAPMVDFTATDHHIGSSPLLWNVSTSFGGLKRVQPNFATGGIVERFDIRPELSLPLAGEGWHLLASAAVRETVYSRSRKTPYGVTATPVELTEPINRSSAEFKVDVRPPAIERTFEVPERWQKLFGPEIKHTVEPQLVYRNTQGIGTTFFGLLRFDDVDLDSNTNELEYGVTQHLYFRPRAPKPTAHPCPAEEVAQEEADPDALISTEGGTDANGIPTVTVGAPTRAHHRGDCIPAKPQQQEWFSWKLAQRHFFDSSFGGAVINTRRNVFDSTLSLSGIAFLTEARDISPLISRLRFRTSSHTDVEWNFDLDTGAKKFTSNNIFIDVHEKQFFSGLSYAFLNAPGRFYTVNIDNTTNKSTITPSAVSDFAQMRFLLGYGAPTKPGLSVAGNVGLDIDHASLQYGSLQASYNWNCCGLSVEYRKYELGSTRNEGVERFSFTLINIGTAGNLRRQERLF